jgi:hypothetical protein
LFGEVYIPALIGLDGHALAANSETFAIAREGLRQARPDNGSSRRPKMVEADTNCE